MTRNTNQWDDRRRARSSIHRGHITRNHAKDRQRYSMETVNGTSFDDVEDVQPIGFTSNPRVGDNTEVIVAELGGEASRMVIIAKVGDSTKHLQVQEGSMAIFSPDAPENQIVIHDDGRIVINGAKSLDVEVPEVNMKTNLNVDGNITTTGDVTSDGVHQAAGHV